MTKLDLVLLWIGLSIPGIWLILLFGWVNGAFNSLYARRSK